MLKAGFGLSDSPRGSLTEWVEGGGGGGKGSEKAKKRRRGEQRTERESMPSQSSVVASRRP